MSIGILTDLTPSQKAKDLISIFHDNILSFLNDRMKLENAKRCALISVDEIIKSRQEDRNFDDRLLQASSEYSSLHPMMLSYWLEVKKEIETYGTKE